MKVRRIPGYGSGTEVAPPSFLAFAPPPNPPPRGGRALTYAAQSGNQFPILSPPSSWGRVRVGVVTTPEVETRSSPSRERSTLRRGVTIIETIVLMTGVAAMLGLAVILLQLLMKLDGDSRARFDAASSMARLARQFRHDVHAAGSARLVEPAARGLVLSVEPGPERTIEYRVKGDDRVIRVEMGKGAEARREAFSIPRSHSIRLALDEDQGHTFASLTVDRMTARNRTDPPRRYEILARVGKNSGRVPGAAKSAGEKP
jgi:hypothetical protein